MESWAIRHGREGDIARRRRERLRAAYGDVALAVLDALIACDPLGIVQEGAPPEQYVHEAGVLCIRLQDVATEEEAAQTFVEVMEETVGPPEDGQESRYDACIRRVWEIWQQAGGE